MKRKLPAQHNEISWSKPLPLGRLPSLQVDILLVAGEKVEGTAWIAFLGL